jgi:hypothetical protein
MLPKGEAYPDEDLDVDCCFARSPDTSDADRTASLLPGACDITTVGLDITQTGQSVNGAPRHSISIYVWEPGGSAPSRGKPKEAAP